MSSSQSPQNPDAIGTTYIFRYSDSEYHITLKNADTLHWKLTQGSLDGDTEGENPYFVNTVSQGILFLSWRESDGLMVFNILNFNTGELITHGYFNDMFTNPGTVALLQDTTDNT